MMQITYQKKNGSIMKRYRNTILPYSIGETTSMGWKVLNIEYKYNDKFYNQYDYCILVKKSKEKYLKRKEKIESIVQEIKRILYYFIAAIIINFLKLLLGI